MKPVDEDASVGIARASVVRDDDALSERVSFVHDRLKTAAIVEEFIAGREIYVGVVGNDSPKALPPIEMVFDTGVPDEARIATFKVKWSTKHRDRMGVKNRIASDLPPEVQTRLAEVAVASYKAAGLRDYGRVDVRLAHDHEIYVVEANPNPYLSDGEDMAWAAEEGGFPYGELLEAIVEMALKRGTPPGLSPCRARAIRLAPASTRRPPATTDAGRQRRLFRPAHRGAEPAVRAAGHLARRGGGQADGRGGGGHREGGAQPGGGDRPGGPAGGGQAGRTAGAWSTSAPAPPGAWARWTPPSACPPSAFRRRWRWRSSPAGRTP